MDGENAYRIRTARHGGGRAAVVVGPTTVRGHDDVGWNRLTATGHAPAGAPAV
ncbi:hypothetical protein AB0L71_15760 [Streptomyces sp. NPDC052052]|uniref:hypothetical protein n=1 Tax=Streptomyces sp. NPDC052052 TaxID=3154756 RepID=UPI00342FFF42